MTAHNEAGFEIATVSLVRNEADIIESCVRHHINHVDHMHVILHRPKGPGDLADNTEQILCNLIEEGLPIELTYFESQNYMQRDVITTKVREVASTMGGGWILPLDADEFILPLHHKTLAESLSDLPDDRAQLIPWRTYVPTGQDDLSQENPALRIQHRRVREAQDFDKILVPAKIAKHPKSRISQGSHRFKIGKQHLSIPSETIALGHIPIRSCRQIRTKIFNGWLRDLASRPKSDGPNRHWGDLYQRLANAKEISLECLQDLALSYNAGDETAEDHSIILDPIPLKNAALRYDQEPIDPYELLGKTAAVFAEELGENRRSSFLPWKQ